MLYRIPQTDDLIIASNDKEIIRVLMGHWKRHLTIREYIDGASIRIETHIGEKVRTDTAANFVKDLLRYNLLKKVDIN